MDVDPVAYEKARARIDAILNGDSCHPTSDLKTHTILKNFRHIKSVLSEVDKKLLDTGVDGILMDLGMSSMQVCFHCIYWFLAIHDLSFMHHIGFYFFVLSLSRINFSYIFRG